MEEKFSLLLKKFIRIKFGNRVIYMPRVSSNIYFEDHKLSIDMADMNNYVIVDGIRCYYCLIYDAEKDAVQTWLKDSTIDGLIAPQESYYSFPLNAKEFPLSKRDLRMVVPKRDYSEVTLAFLAEHQDLDERVVKFLEKYPEKFDEAEQREWIVFSESLNSPYFTADHLELPQSVAELFRSEMLG